MSLLKQRILAALLPASAFVLCMGMAAQAQTPQPLPIDQPTQVDGVRAACTGIGDREENEGRWSSYPLKLETVGGYGQWLGDQDVTVRGRGEDVNVHCSGPWVVMDLQPGRYDATVTVPDATPKQIRFTVPKAGQRDVIVRFHSRMNGREETNQS